MALTEPQAGSSLTDVKTTATPTDARALPGPRQQGLHLGRRPRSDREHRPPDAGAHRRRAAGHQGRVALRGPEEARRGRQARRPTTCTAPARSTRWAGAGSRASRSTSARAATATAGSSASPTRGISYMFQMMNEARLMVGMQRDRHGVGRVLRVARVRAHAPAGAAARRRRTRRRRRCPSSSTPTSAGCSCARRRSSRARWRSAFRPRGTRTSRRTARRRRTSGARVPAPRHDDADRQDVLRRRRASSRTRSRVQIHGGYGYTSEYLPEAWLRDQKLNSIHEGTTCMHGLDLLGRKVVAEQGGALRVCSARRSAPRSRRAARAGVDAGWCAALERAMGDRRRGHRCSSARSAWPGRSTR